MAEYAYTKLRSEFGRQCWFSDRMVELMVNIRPNEQIAADYMRRDPVNRAIQISSFQHYSEHHVNTSFIEFINQGINHSEGGWPKDVSAADPEQTTRYRRKLEKDEQYAMQMMSLAAPIEHCEMQNNAVDIYNTFFTDCPQLITSDYEKPEVKIVCTFKDPNEIKRPVTSIAWHPEGPDRMVVSHCVVNFQHHTPDTSLECYVYRTEDLSKADVTLSSNFPVCSLRYAIKDVSLVIGGQHNGQVALWDVRRGKMPVERSVLANSHGDPAYKVVWVQSKSNTEFFSTSTDGQVLWWDYRKLAEPIEQMWIDPTKKQEKATAEGGLCLDFEGSMPTKFMVGTEMGSVHLCSRKAKTPAEKVSMSFQTHYGPVYTIQRHPTYPKHFLTIGDWSTKIWSEDVRDWPLWTSGPMMQCPGDAHWSTTRPGVMYVAKMNGTLDVWDFLFLCKKPILNVTVSDCPLITVEPEDRGSLIAVGSENGNTTIMELSHHLIDLQRNEKNLFLNWLERETRREKILEGRAKEKKLAQKQAAEGTAEPAAAAQERNMDEKIAEAEQDFFDLIRKERKRLGRESKKLKGIIVDVTKKGIAFGDDEERSIADQSSVADTSDLSASSRQDDSESAAGQLEAVKEMNDSDEEEDQPPPGEETRPQAASGEETRPDAATGEGQEHSEGQTDPQPGEGQGQPSQSQDQEPAEGQQQSQPAEGEEQAQSVEQREGQEQPEEQPQ